MPNHVRTPLAVIAVVMTLSACSPSPVEKAERKLQMIEKHGTGREVCAAKQEVAQAYLEDLNTREYDLAKLQADIYCQNEELKRRLGR